MQGDRERCLAAGFDGYLAKPMRQADLQSALERLEPLETPHPPDADRSLIEGLTEICGGDEDFARELALTFLESAPGCLAGIELSAREQRLAGALGTGPRLERDQPDDRRREAGTCLRRPRAGLAIARTSSAQPAQAAHLASAWEVVKTTLEEFLAVEIKA